MSTNYGTHQADASTAPPVVIVQQAPPRKRTHHVLHAIATVATGGAWGIVWIVQTLRHNTR